MSAIVKAVLVAAIGINVYFYLNPTVTPKLPSPVIDTKSGKVQGVISVSRGGRSFFEYLGIPYAKPPVGDLRFESPQPVEKWKDIRPANEAGSQCIQMDFYVGAIHGSEDCLFLNVYTPKINTEKPLSVLVWIHGGMFHIGAGSIHGPEYFMDEDVVLVTLNYRLGAFGFLSTEDEVVRGNMGLKDQNLALRWIKNNIANFGGDPNRITISGESAGGASVHHQVVSPKSKGLFQRAISQSGVVNNPWSIRRHPGAQAKRFGEIMKCPTGNSKEMVACMKAASPTAVMDAHRNVVNTLRDPITVFTPVVEAVNDKDAFLAEDPVEILKEGRANNVPWITGVNSEEGLLSTAPLLAKSLLPKVKAEWDELLPWMMWYSDEPSPQKLEKITNFYMGSKDNIDAKDKFVNLTNLFTDTIFTLGTHEAVRLQAKYSPVYLYYYSYKGSFSLANLLLGLQGRFSPKLELMYFFGKRWFEKTFLGIEPHHYGACHFDEVAMLFPLTSRGSQISTKDKDYEISRDLVKLWVAFANDDKTMRFNGRVWPSVDPTEEPLQYFHLHPTHPRMINEPFGERIKFLKTLNLKNII